MLINNKPFNCFRFSSGELKLVRSELNSFVENNSVTILTENDYSLFELFLIIDYYKQNNVKINLILTYLPYQRMDHKGRDELNTLGDVANLFNYFKLNSLLICEPHGDIEEFNNAKKYSYIDALCERVFKEIKFNKDKDYVVFTDNGSYNRYNYLSNNKVQFEKERDKQTGEICKHNIIGNLDVSKKIVIVDDIISTGTTIINVVNKLTELGAKEIYVLCGHIENNKLNNSVIKNENIKKIFSTNSLRRRGNKKLKLYNIRNFKYE